MAPSIDTPDYRRAVVAAQALLATVPSPGASATVTLPANTQTLVVACQGSAGTITATVTGVSTGAAYPGTQLKQGVNTGVSTTFHFAVSTAVDSQVTVAVSGAPDWWVYADHARHAVVYPSAVPPPTTPPIIFCQEDNSGNGQLCAINFDGTGFVQVTSDTHDYLWPRWNRAGTKIALGDSSNRLWTCNPDGSALTQITNVATGPQIGFYQGDWSPDGSRLVVIGTTTSGGSTARSDLQIVNADNSGHTAVALTEQFALDLACPVSWSPDGTRFLYAGWTGAVNVFNATSCLINGTGPVDILAANSSLTYNPWRWYADSTNILVLQENQTAQTVSLQKSDGSTTTTLYSNGEFSPILGYGASLGAVDPTGAKYAWNSADGATMKGLTPPGSPATIYTYTGFGNSQGMDWLQ